MESPLRQMREKLSMNQHQMAMALQISQSHVSHIELGYVALSKHVIKELSELNFDAKKLAELQQEFVEHKRQEWSVRLSNAARKAGEAQ